MATSSRLSGKRDIQPYCPVWNIVSTLWFLADRTDGRAYATVLRLSVCRL